VTVDTTVVTAPPLFDTEPIELLLVSVQYTRLSSTAIAVGVPRPVAIHRLLFVTHDPWTQTSPEVHALPHEPQLPTSTPVATQVPAHSSNPVGQPMLHVEFAQSGGPPASPPGEHAWPQPPQLFGSAVVSTRQAPLQRVSPGPQTSGVVPQDPLLHVATEPEAAVHGWPHVPQLDGSLERSMHRPVPQLAVGAAHDATHPPEAQSGVAPEQEVAQLPQVCALVRSASQPFVGSPSQSAHPLLQLTISQAPWALQRALPFREQALALHCEQLVPAG
jgi:hypothetical protein